MQIKYLHKRLYYLNKHVEDRELSSIAQERLEKLKQYKALREGGCKQAVILKLLGVSRATYYRWRKAYRKKGPIGLEPQARSPKTRRKPQWKLEAFAELYRQRKQYPTWGKRRLQVLLEREFGWKLSESSVGRMLKHLMKQKKIKPAAWYASGRLKLKQPRRFSGHSKRYRAGQKARQPGELIQIDHMSVVIEPGRVIKHFKAICPVTRLVVCQAYSRATSTIAANFLEDLQKQLPYRIRSIQVDGGSEFRAVFEASCQAQGIALFVLPPRSPKLNGCVERANRTFRSEFYRQYTGEAQLKYLRKALRKYCDLYNTFRPHQSLQGATPWAYYQQMAWSPSFVSS